MSCIQERTRCPGQAPSACAMQSWETSRETPTITRLLARLLAYTTTKPSASPRTSARATSSPTCCREGSLVRAADEGRCRCIPQSIPGPRLRGAVRLRPSRGRHPHRPGLGPPASREPLGGASRSRTRPAHEHRHGLPLRPGGCEGGTGGEGETGKAVGAGLGPLLHA